MRQRGVRLNLQQMNLRPKNSLSLGILAQIDAGNPAESATPLSVSDHGADTASVMASYLQKLEHLLVVAQWSEVEVVELLALYNDAAYVQFTLSEVEDEGARHELEQICSRFFRDADIRYVLRDRLSKASTHGEPEAARREFLAQLEAPNDASDATLDSAVAQLLAAVAARAGGQRALLTRLGMNGASISNTSVAMNALLASTESESVRSKLWRAWQLQTDVRAEEIVDCVDAVVNTRRSATGVNTSWNPAPADTANLRQHLTDSLRAAVDAHQALTEATRRCASSRDPALGANFARATQLIVGDAPVAFDADRIVAHAFALAREIDPSFDLEQNGTGRFVGSRGIITVDIWGNGSGQNVVAHSETLRNRMAWKSWNQLPVARVQCGLRPQSSSMLSLQGATTLLHEVGHAVNHVISTGKLSYTSGLFYLPSERRECMSMWFERRALDDALLLPAVQNDIGLAGRVRLARQLSEGRIWLERVLAASMDFALHVDGDSDFRSAYQRITAGLDIGVMCAIGDIASHFSSGRYTSRPGGAIAYVIGEAFSRSIGAPGAGGFASAAFVPLLTQNVNFAIPRIVRPNPAELLNDWLLTNRKTSRF